MQVKANAGCAAREHVTRVCAIRAHAQRLPLAVIVFLFALFVASVAYAEDWYSVLYRSELDGSEQYIVSADDKWQAAAIICGRNKTFIDGLDDETRRKLSTNGGAFQNLAESLDDDWPSWNDESLSDSLADTFGGDVSGSLWQRMTSVYLDMSTFPFMHYNPDGLSKVTVALWQESCPTHIFAANIDPTLRGAANEALTFISNGGSLGGGGNVENVPNGYEILTGGSRSGDIFTVESKTQDTSKQSFPVDVSANASMFADYPHYIVYMNEGYNTAPTGTANFKGYAVPDGVYILRNSSNNDYVYLWNSNGTSVQYKYITRSYKAIGDLYVVDQRTVSNGSLNAGQISLIQQAREYYIATDTVGSGGGGDDEPNPWPEPEPPEQPNVPEPPDVNPPPIGGPVFPTDPPEDPTITPEPEPSGTDYTIYFRAIIRQINQVMVQMSNHCKHIRDQISTSANAIISNLHTYIEDLQESIDSNFSALNDYLEDLTKWYEDFTQDIVDDILDEFSTVESILRQILRKIGVSRGTPKEVEKEVDDDFNFLEWLINFITSKLAGVIDEFVGDVGSLIEGVKDKFPFSIPWDIMGVLALLDGVRATPRFEITLPAVSGWWQQTTFVIDLSPFDSVASAVRMMINAWWVLVLALKTNWMLMIMGDSTSLGERIANRISGGGE